MVIDILHEKLPSVESSSKKELSKANLQKMLGTMYKVDPATVILFGLKTVFGGGKTTGFALIYDDITALKKIEPVHRQVRHGLRPKVETSRKQKKERKNREKRIWGAKKHEAAAAKKDEKKK